MMWGMGTFGFYYIMFGVGLDLSRSSRFSIMSCYIETEGYYAKLGNVKQIEIDD